MLLSIGGKNRAEKGYLRKLIESGFDGYQPDNVSLSVALENRRKEGPDQICGEINGCSNSPAVHTFVLLRLRSDRAG